MDLKTIDLAGAAQRGTQVSLRHPVTNAPLLDEDHKPITIQVLGKDSSIYLQVQRRLSDARLNASLGRGSKFKISSAQLEQDTIELLASVTVGWSENFKLGDITEFTHETAMSVYESASWIREQVSEVVEDRSAFLGN